MRVAVLRQDPRLDQTVLEALRTGGVDTGLFETVPDLLAIGPEKLKSIEVLFAPGHVSIGDDVLALLPGLAGLISPYMGIEGFDRAAATARGILIANGQIPESIESMAEGTVLMLLAAAYQLPAAMAAMADGAWPRPLARGRLVRAMTVGIVGFGRIAQAVVERLIPFGCRLVVYAPRLRVPLPPGVEALPLDTLVASSDAIILLASLGPDSSRMFDAALIERLKPGAIVVNMARGGLVDEAALVAAAGRLGCLVLDVFEQEPLPANAAIRAVPNSILTPHTIGHTGDTIARLPLHALDCILSILAGDPPESLVNPEALPAWQERRRAIPGEYQSNSQADEAPE